MIGTTLDGRYLITRQLGAGAMGSVYEAEHAATRRRVAVKVISAGHLTRDEMTVNRFQREARAAGAIDTQHITQVLDAGTDRENNLPFLVLELLAGEDLQHLLKRVGPVDPDLALRVVAQACLGLQKAHEANVIHRDIKPANLFLARRDADEILVKILDFGIAKIKMDQTDDPDGHGLTQTGSMLGSPLYMSPEQARGSKAIDHRADIWSLGVVLYQALCGRTPYQHATALGELIIAICQEFPPHVQEFAPWVPPEIAAIVHRAIRQNPAERYQSAAEMLAAIRPLLPNGWSIRQDMLVPLHETVRSHVAPRFSLTSALGAAQTVAPAGQLAGFMTAGVASQAPRSIAPSGPASRVPLLIGAAVLVVTVATSAYMQRTPPVAPLPAPPVIAPSAPLPAPTEAPTVSPQPEQPPLSVPVRRVKVMVLPPDASIEMEGKSASLRDGMLEIEGALGSVHRVRLFKGKSESTTDVIVTETGPRPPKLVLISGTLKAPSADGGVEKPPDKPVISNDVSEFKQ